MWNAQKLGSFLHTPVNVTTSSLLKASSLLSETFSRLPSTFNIVNLATFDIVNLATFYIVNLATFYIVSLALSIFSALHFLYCQPWTFYIVSLELSSALNFLYCQPWTFHIVSLELSILSALNFLYCQPWTFFSLELSILSALNFLYCQLWTFYIVSLELSSALNFLYCQPWTFYIVSLELSSALHFLYCQPWTCYIVSLELSILSALNFHCKPWILRDHFTKKQASFQSDLAFTFTAYNWLLLWAHFKKSSACFPKSGWSKVTLSRKQAWFYTSRLAFVEEDLGCFLCHRGWDVKCPKAR